MPQPSVLSRTTQICSPDELRVLSRVCIITTVKSSTALLVFLSEQPNNRLYDPEGRVNRLLRDAIEYPGSPGGMSQLLAGLEAKGLIQRVLHGRRCPVVELTPAGAEFLVSEGVTTASASKPAAKAVSKATAKVTAKQAAAEAALAEEVPEKRKPGRPKKAVAAVDEVAEKRKPGRPKKAVAVEEVPAAPEKRKPGRPKKAVAEASAPVAVPASVPDEEWEAPAKKPGRQKKVAQADTTAPAATPEAPISASETELLDTSEIAQALLSLVVSELTNLDGRAASEAAIRDELAQSAARAEALEERTRSLEDSLAYAKAEAQAERARADRLEKNLDAVMKGPDTSRGKEEARRQLERLISARPGR